MASYRFRALEPEDLDFISRWENDPEQWDYSDTVAPLSRVQLKNYIDTYDPDPFHAGQLRLMVEDIRQHEPVGIVDLYKISAVHARAMVGIFIDPAYRRRGIGTASLRRLAAYVRDRLGLHQLAAIIAADNIASQELFRKCGYVHSGTLSQWRRLPSGLMDVHIYQLILL